MKLSEIIQRAKRTVLNPSILIHDYEILVSVRGYEFGFETELSPFTSSLVTEAVERTVGWLKAEEY